jgi:excinuclease ABC subunit A
VSELIVRGARQHNLRNVDVAIPRDRLTVITGPSGSGKSSLAFDTIYAEGQRRYVESLSAYARQFLDQMPKPDVDFIDGLSPAIAIRQATTSRNPRSTVGTVTEIYDHLRLLYARVGAVHCPVCGRPIRAMTVQQMVDRVLSLPDKTRFAVQAPLPDAAVADPDALLDRLQKEGFVRVVVGGAVLDVADRPTLAPGTPIDVQIDRLSIKDNVRQRLTEAVELALSLSEGLVRVVPRDGEAMLLSEGYRCPDHGPVLAELTPKTFSFNSPEGACRSCSGLGEERVFEPSRIVPDPRLTLADGALAPWGKATAPYYRTMLRKLVDALGVPTDRPWSKLTKKQREAILEGKAKRGRKAGWDGVVPILEQRARDYAERKREAGEVESAVEYLEDELGRFVVKRVCRECGGTRLRAEALAVRVGDRGIASLTAASVEDARGFFEGLALEGQEAALGERLVREIRSRLAFLEGVGLGYLSLDRPSATLSGGEAQRIRLATQIGSALIGVLYVLDEPSIGLHARDNARLLKTLLALRDRGNTVLVVEHDPETIRAADHVVDMGPGAGTEGGRVVASGTVEAILADEASPTGAYLSGRGLRATPSTRRSARGWLRVVGATTHNLRGVDVAFPVGCFTAVTGVSGSGKSSLVSDTLLPLARAALHRAEVGEIPATLEGLEAFDKVVSVDQDPIGRTPRSNPATFTGVFNDLRSLFASLPEARARGYKAGRFSFNVKGGRCETCQGDGMLRVQMHFLPDVFVLCESCQGQRYNRETLEITYRGRSIADVLAMPVADALAFFEVLPKVADKLRALARVGLDYLTLGQSATTLSGGEAQRLKLAKELARKESGSTLYVLDEPTTGLHFQDVDVLMDALFDLVERGNTVLVIEHDLGVVRMADHVVDLGPEGGDGGGRVVAQGTPEEIAVQPESITGRYLADVL